MFYVLRNRNFWIMLIMDVLLLILSYFFAYYLRFDGDIPYRELNNFLRTFTWIVSLKLLAFFWFNLYKGMWRYTSIHDMANLGKACLTSSGAIVLILLAAVRFHGFARSIFFIDFVLTFILVGGYRVGIRLYYARREGQYRFAFSRIPSAGVKRILIIGAGDAGEKLIREIRENPHLRYDVIGLIDDRRSKLHQTIHGVPVLGSTEDLERLAGGSRIDEIIIAAPSATAAQMRRLVKLCEETGIPYKTMPGLGELIDGRVSVSAVRPVRYEDLMGRNPVELHTEQIGGYLTGKRVLVTGGAGSIGSELCRQIAPFHPETLIVLDRDESGLYEIEMDFSTRYPALKTHFVLGAIQYTEPMERLFKTSNPQVVFHAAAYKHVPMMEAHPWEAVYNNIVGSRVLLDLCLAHGVERAVIVSTDKAVRPTNVMGASKRVVEQLTQAYAHANHTRLMAVRFGNVVGSAGSVMPLFENQIQKGGPVTVTHPEVTRYFMTIPEASRLILQAGALGKGGEIFILKMGTPIRILEMARDMIRLSGFRPDEDIEIRFTGLRPGEKLYEELITEGEGIRKTQHEDILVLNTENGVSLEDLGRHIDALVKMARAGDCDAIKQKLREIVPEYSPQL